MAKGNDVIAEVGRERGKFFEGYLATGTTPKPGIVMEIDRGTAVRDGKAFTWNPAGVDAASGVQGMAADGNRLPIVILLPDKLQGKTRDDPYVDSARIFLYVPQEGEELNMLLENQSGTADDFVIGDKLIVDDGTGKLLISAGTPEAEPFISLEAVTDLAADYYLWCFYTAV